MASLAGLNKYVRAKVEEVIAQSEKALTGDYTIMITQGYRSKSEQDALYAKGRTTAQLRAKGIYGISGKPNEAKVTNAPGGKSMHNYGYAFDIALKTRDGKKVVWDINKDFDGDGKADWMEIVAIAKKLGFEWGGDWRTFKDYPHFQMTAGLSDSQIFNGAVPNFPEIGGTVEKESISKPASTGSKYIKAAQEFANSRNYPSKEKANFKKLTVDGYSGPKTVEALTRILQYYGKVTVDGDWGPKTEKATRLVKQGSTDQWWNHLAQAALNLNGAKLAVDGIIGSGSVAAIKEFQRAHDLTADGIIGTKTWKALLN